MGKDNKIFVKRILIFSVMFLASGGIAFAGSLLHQPGTETLMRNIIMALAGTGIVIYAYLFSEVTGLFIYRNEGKYGRFASVYLASLAGAVLLPYLPVDRKSVV